MKTIPLPLLALTGVLSASVFLIAMALNMAASFPVIKALPVFSLAVWVWPRGDKRIAAGLILGAIGDYLLQLPDAFLFGMVAFALGHLCYVWAFCAWERRFALILAVPVALYLSWSMSLVLPGAGAMLVSVIGYAVIIGLMIWRAAAVAECETGAGFARWSPLAGALLFGFSDTLISINLFGTPLPGAHYAIMLTYWGGQALIAAAAVHRLRGLRKK